MEEGGEAGSAKPNPTVAQICEECKANPSKYKCPGCSIRSCSLPCVKAHKLRTGCTGKRNQTNFVPLSQIDNNQLLSDYNLLEEVKRVSESAQRLRNKLCRYNYYRLPDHLKSLRGAASSRRTKLLFLPSGMSKREKNQTRYDRSQVANSRLYLKKKCISWTIEWRFHSTDVVLTDHEVNENTKFCSIIENHLKPGPWNHQLRLFCEEQLDCLRLFIRKYPKSLDFGVVKNATPSFCKPELKTYGRNDPSAGGVPFKEEEIEEDNSYPKVFDLMKRETSSSLPLISSRSRCEKAPDDSLTKTLPATVATDNDSHSDSNAKEQGLFEDMDFDFDQGLIDTYSNLIAEINPDDFLDLEGELTKEELEERNLSSVRKFLLADDDIEEGEILE
ncbi:hypothetical protein PRUPE_2G005000 [Prunus persica]|uniref:Box C/D snoRNA protein 1 n=1 Tax=Prunus persica TaxID=3760 RepID=A0A251Q900_PRUPE|nr:hypothetical protein PRUPE_2G005000 [Prunus persica]ONI20258.1 hypothetical protein PRUPE_2G005000 [Prunus persica]